MVGFRNWPRNWIQSSHTWTLVSHETDYFNRFAEQSELSHLSIWTRIQIRGRTERLTPKYRYPIELTLPSSIIANNKFFYLVRIIYLSVINQFISLNNNNPEILPKYTTFYSKGREKSILILFYDILKNYNILSSTN